MFLNRSSVIPRNWRKSSHSGQDGDCLEAGSADGVVHVRDTKDAKAGPVLAFTADQWRALTESLKR
ncbi:MAG TPA: DUF397 domain-containing protein [Arthrobacter sp.]|nr:DUF397 domain-containing protein [Arthrobacter sp.]